MRTYRAIDYRASTKPTVLVGTFEQGDESDLEDDDNDYYKLEDVGIAPTLSYEVTSEVIKFPTVSLGEVSLIAAASQPGTTVKVFIFNPDDPGHSQGGYSPTPDAMVTLSQAGVEESVTAQLDGPDVTYLNTLSTKTVKIKIEATNAQKFRLDVDKLVFRIGGDAAVDQRDFLGTPAISTGSILSGTVNNLGKDDTSFYTLSSSGNTVEFELTSDDFLFTSVDGVTVPFVARSDQDGVVLQMFVYDGSYSPTPDLQTTIPLKNTDKSAILTVSPADLTYLNGLSPISLRLKVRATHTSAFKLEMDMIAPFATSVTDVGTIAKKATHEYIDPGLRNPVMANVAAKEGYLLRVYHARPGVLNANWAYNPSGSGNEQTLLQVFRALVIDGGAVASPGKITTKPSATNNELVRQETSQPGETFVRTGFVSLEAGLYSLVFFNDSTSTAATSSFAASGAKEDTWIFAAAFRDYVVEAIAEGVGLKAVVRQVPGPSEPPNAPWSNTNIDWIRNLAFIQSWEAFGAVASTGSAAPTPTPTATPIITRVIDGLVVLYDFEETSGPTVFDVSGIGTPLNLTILNESATSRASGALSINSSTIVKSSVTATKIIDAAQATNEITIEGWVKPANLTQGRPSRIVTLSANPSVRNLTLAQQQTYYDTRLRTTSTSSNGTPSLSTPSGSLTTSLTHVVYTRSHPSGDTKTYINGAQVASGNTPSSFSNWDQTFKFALANELTLDRTWLGELHLVAVYDRALTPAQVLQNYNAGAQGITLTPTPTATPTPFPIGVRVRADLWRSTSSRKRAAPR